METSGKRTKDVTLDDSSINFESLFLSNEVIQGLNDCLYLKPTPVQLRAIPLGKCGFDLIVKAKSGTGKTGVFSIIALEMINTQCNNLQVIILSPTREITVQTCNLIKTLGKFIPYLKVEYFIGGLPVRNDFNKVKGCHIAVASPGRILQLANSKRLKLDHVKLLVLDEADKLMSSSFQFDINKIYNFLPKTKQMLALSATYPRGLDTYISKYMNMPTLVDGNEMKTPFLLGLKQFVTITPFNANILFLTKFKNQELLKLLTKISFTQCLVFCNYQTRVEDVNTFLNANGWKSSYISAALSQPKRLEVLQELKEFGCRILISTDLTARGIDATNVDLVINYEIPEDENTYLHRMGRAGRYGAKGICYTIAAKGQEVEEFCEIIGNIGGIAMAVPILPAQEIPNNIWETNLDGHKCLNGKVMKRQDLSLLEPVRKMYVSNHPKPVEEEENMDVDRIGSLGESSRFNVSFKTETNEEEDNEEMNDSKNISIKEEVSEDEVNGINILELKCESESDSDFETTDILKQLATGCISTKKQTKSTPKTKESIFQKNMSLYKVSSLLADDNMDVENTDCDNTIETYITSMKYQDNEISEEITEEQPTDVNKTPNIEDIFTYAYDYAVNKSTKNWEHLFQFEEAEEGNEVISTNEPVNLLQDLLEYAANDDAPEYDNYDDEQDQDDDYIQDNYPQKFHNESPQTSSLQWIPVELNYSNSTRKPVTTVSRKSKSQTDNMPISTKRKTLQFENLYSTALQGFENTFNSLESMHEFEDAWKKWQLHITSIRDYVQQNVYLDEMNAYNESLNE